MRSVHQRDVHHRNVYRAHATSTSVTFTELKCVAVMNGTLVIVNHHQ
jgi:hypothetical protein